MCGMITRGTVIAGLLALELAVVVEAVVAVRGGRPGPTFASHSRALAAPDPRLREAGAHQIFAGGAHPALTVDIGYADLTILTREAPQIDVSLSPDPDPGIFGNKAPIVVRNDGGTIRIAKTPGRNWSTGDDRMVTVLVPSNTRVSVASAGNIRATGLRAETTLRAVGQGDIVVEDYAAPSLHVASEGSVTLDRIAADRLDATSKDDAVDGSALRVRDGRIEAEDRITLEFAPASDARVIAQTANGTIDVSGFDVPPSPAGNNTATDGADSASRVLRLGAGNGSFDIRSHDGSITLARDSR